MRKVVIAALIVFLLSGFILAEVKIGIINAQKLIEGTKKGRALSDKLEKFGKEKQDQITAMQNEIKKIEKELVSPALNEATKEKKALDMQNKRTDLKRFVEDSQRGMQNLTQVEMQALQEEIKPIIQQIGRTKGLTIILEITAVAYFDESVDITDDIIRIMDSRTGGSPIK